jgi:hypothetical protein
MSLGRGSNNYVIALSIAIHVRMNLLSPSFRCIYIDKMAVANRYNRKTLKGIEVMI